MQNDNRSSQRGFTLVEVMVVIVILGMLATIVTSSLLRSGDEARISTTKMQVLEFQKTVDLYYNTNAKMPEDFTVLIEKDTTGRAYLDNLSEPPSDPWNNEYRIVPGASGRANDRIVMSCGPDGQEGTEDDITSANARSKTPK